MTKLKDGYKYTLWVLSCLIIFGCASKRIEKSLDFKQIIRIKGSDTMLLLVQRWAEEYMKAHPGISIYTEGGGSATGIRALINGTIDICSASRPWQPDEIKELVEKQGSLGIRILTAKDALSIYLHPENPVRNLSLEQIKNIFIGETTNWKEAGGVDEPIVVLNRNPNSGTYLFLEQRVLLGAPYSPYAETMPTTSAIVNAVAKNRAAIGYGGLAYGTNVYHCKINGIEPTLENVRNGTYPIARYLYFYTVSPPRGLLKDFIDWVLSAEGQKIVREVGYIPLYEIQ